MIRPKQHVSNRTPQRDTSLRQGQWLFQSHSVCSRATHPFPPEPWARVCGIALWAPITTGLFQSLLGREVEPEKAVLGHCGMTWVLPTSPQRELRPRLCTMKKGPNGYGFNLHSDKSKPGQFIRAVDPDSPAEASGLRAQDRIVEVSPFQYSPCSPRLFPPNL